jgi:hypothetical protein
MILIPCVGCAIHLSLADGVANLYARIERMRELGPTFIDITWGAGGTRADTTAQFVKAAHEEFGLETCMHLTCTDMPRDHVEKALEVGSVPVLLVWYILKLTLIESNAGRIQVRLPQHPCSSR